MRKAFQVPTPALPSRLHRELLLIIPASAVKDAGELMRQPSAAIRVGHFLFLSNFSGICNYATRLFPLSSIGGASHLNRAALRTLLVISAPTAPRVVAPEN
jgi:hypothetical protein